MSTLLEKAMERVRRLPVDLQDEIARAMLSVADDKGEPEPVDASHRSAVLDGLREAESGYFASEAEIAAALARFKT